MVLDVRSVKRYPRVGAVAQGAAASVSLILRVEDGASGFHRTATRETRGTTSLSSSSRFPANSDVKLASPVTLPPGRAKLATNPSPTGSPLTLTMGIVVVACLAAWTDAVLSAKIAS